MKTKWQSHLRPIIGLTIISLLICGFFFPLLITGIAQSALPNQANGDLAQLDGRTLGSFLIDNNFTAPIFFHTRNESNPLNASASRVDPDITIGEAYSQIPRISNWTGISQNELKNIVNSNEQGTFWIFGSPYVDVLKINLVLIQSYPSIYKDYPKS